MWNSRVLDYRIVIAFLFSALMGVVLIPLLPIFTSNPLFLLAIPIGGLFFILMVVKPAWTLAILLLSRPLLDLLLNLTKVSVGGEEMGIGALLNLVIIIMAVFMAFYYSTFPHREKTVLCWIIFLALMLVAVVNSPFQGRAIRLYFNYVSYFSMLLIPFLVIKTKEDWVFWMKILAGSFVLPILFANFDLARGGQYYASAGMRIAGTFTHPNILAFYLVLGLTIYFYLLKDNPLKLKPRWIWALKILMLNMIVLLIATKTRNAWVACFGGFFIYGWFKDQKFLLVLFLFVVGLLLIPPVQERVMTVVSKSQSSDYQGINSWEWRREMWKSSLPRIAERPLQGYGLTSFKPMSEQFSDVGRNMGAHNVYLEVLFETGIFGLLSFIALFLSPLIIFSKKMFQDNQTSAKLAAILVGYIVSYMIICSADNLLYYLVLNWYVWFFLGLMLVKERLT
ncbi:MAG: O-antigen ligase family protein [Candidatus Omnitrophica bacterium]|nr:O-antigen ligase family protein [Candidatus Omnitrophota bacterium]